VTLNIKAKTAIPSLLFFSLTLFIGCRTNGFPPAEAQGPTSQQMAEGQPLAEPPPEGMAVAIFAGGCFWCMEGPFEALDGVSEVLSGYTGGDEPHPTYQQVSSGRTGHAEAVRVVYDPSVVSYETLLDTYWRSMDPTDAGGQFADRGSQYRPAIFVSEAAQREAAEGSKAALEASGRFDEPIIVPIEDAGDFWVAEDYHQNYYRTHPDQYHRYRRGSGRAGFLERVWGADH
jgi:methionine-S-sulfoxide reductase